MSELQLPIVQVTLLEDRALIRRQGIVELKGGVQRLRLRNVAPSLVDKTLVSQWNESGVRTLHLRVDRYRPSLAPPPAEESRPDPAVLQRRARLQQELAVQQREAQSAANIYGELLQSISERVGVGEMAFAEWESEIDEVEAWRQSLLERHCQLLEELDALEQPSEPAVWTPPSAPAELHTDLVLEVEAGTAQSSSLVLEYTVPCACWRPIHRAVLEGRQLWFQTDGCCWQNTGEDWNDVQLVFSTQRSSLGSEPPGLPPDRLSVQKKSQTVVVSERDVEIQELEPVAPRTHTAEMPGIDDRGESVQLRSQALASVPSHGRPVRVPIFDFSVEATVDQVLMAELCAEVLQRSSQVNSSPYPLLAGPVDLVREAGHIGRTQLNYVGRGERFTLGWGPQSSLRVVRSEVQGKEEKDDLLGGWVKQVQKITLSLSNLSMQSHSLTVIERVPVSEVKQVEVVVDSKATSQGAAPDARGFVTWTLQLGARERQVLNLEYALRKRKEVVTA